MSLEIIIPPEAEAVIEAEAKRRGRNPEEYAEEVMTALREAAQEFLSDPERLAAVQAGGLDDEEYDRYLLPRLARFFAPGWLEAETDKAVIARGHFARAGGLQMYELATGTENDGNGNAEKHLRVEFFGHLHMHHLRKAIALANTPKRPDAAEVSTEVSTAEAVVDKGTDSLTASWFQNAEQQARAMTSLTADEAMEIIEGFQGPNHMTREEFEQYRYILDAWDSGLEPQGRWKKGRVRLTQIEMDILVVFRGADFVSPGGVQSVTGISRQTQAEWVTQGYVRAFNTKGMTHASMLDVRDHALRLQASRSNAKRNEQVTARAAQRPSTPPEWLADLKPPAGQNGMSELFGHWPGDSEEGLAQELASLRNMKRHAPASEGKARKPNG